LSALAPVFQTQPKSQKASLGATVTLRALPAGTPPLQCQWQLDGTDLTDNERITGSKSNLLVITGLRASDLGNYRLKVDNSYGSATSGLAVVTLPPDCASEWAGLVAWWRGENNVLDSAGLNNGSLIYATYGKGKVGAGFFLNGGINRIVSVPALDLSAGNAMTIETWIKPIAFEENLGAGILRQNSDWLLTFSNNGAFLSFGLNAGGSYEELIVPIAAADYADGSWHHVAATYDGSMKRVYRDGIEIAAAAKTGTIAFSGTGGTIGGHSSDYPYDFFYGSIDEMAIYNRALSASEIQSIYAADTAGKCTERPPLTINAKMLDDHVVLSWNAAASKTYQLQYKSNLSQADWVNLNGAITATNSVMNTSDVIELDGQRFYRILMNP
jgi:hypothetical protein